MRIAAVILLVGCGEGREPPAPAAAASGSATSSLASTFEAHTRAVDRCLDEVRTALAVPISGPGKTSGAIAPHHRAELAAAYLFDVTIERDKTQLHDMVSEPLLDPFGVYRAPALKPHACGRYADLDMIGSTITPEMQASLREPLSPPPLVAYEWTWCDRWPGGRHPEPGPYLCSIGVTWLRLPSREVVASTGATTFHTDDFYVGEADARTELAKRVATWPP